MAFNSNSKNVPFIFLTKASDTTRSFPHIHDEMGLVSTLCYLSGMFSSISRTTSFYGKKKYINVAIKYSTLL